MLCLDLRSRLRTVTSQEFLNGIGKRDALVYYADLLRYFQIERGEIRFSGRPITVTCGLAWDVLALGIGPGNPYRTVARLVKLLRLCREFLKGMNDAIDRMIFVQVKGSGCWHGPSISVFYRSFVENFILGCKLLIIRSLAPRHGFEPRFTAPKAAVLPLDDRGSEVGADFFSVSTNPPVHHSEYSVPVWLF